MKICVLMYSLSPFFSFYISCSNKCQEHCFQNHHICKQFILQLFFLIWHAVTFATVLIWRISVIVWVLSCSLSFFFLFQPDELTNALEISNIVFTSLFALEMLLKMLVYGPFGYIKNPYNIFDGIIVVIRYTCSSSFLS